MEENDKNIEVKEKILKEAQGLFWKYGVKSVTMDDIAKHLGMSKKTLYQFFNDKDDIICHIVDGFLKSREAQIEEVRASAQNSVQGMFLMTCHIKASFENMTPSLLYELKKYHPKAYNIFIDHKKTCLQECIVSNLKTGIEEGVYRDNIDVKVMARMRMEQVEMGFDQAVFPSAEFKLEYIQGQLFEHFVHGITTLKGHQLLNEYKNGSKEN